MTEYQPDQLRNIIEAALLVATRPMSLAQLESVFEHEENPPSRDAIAEVLGNLQAEYETRGIELVEVASGWRMQSRESMSPWIANLFQEKAPRYSRALLETLVLIAYRQPITRGEIEDIRGVAVSSNIVRTLIERDWVKIVGHRDVPGRPSLLGTTKQFLDYFNLQKIGELPTLSEIKALDEIAPELAQEVAMLDKTLAPEGETEVEANEAEQVQSTDTSEATDTNEANVSDVEEQLTESETDAEEQDTAVALEAALPDTDIDEDLSDVVEDNLDVVVSGAQTVDVELPPEVAVVEAQNAQPEEARAEDTVTTTESATESATEEEPEELTGQEDDVVAVAEATIDAMAAAQRSETELLH